MIYHNNRNRVFRWLGSREQAKELWENRESLEKYLARLKELMEGDGKNCDNQVESNERASQLAKQKEERLVQKT